MNAQIESLPVGVIAVVLARSHRFPRDPETDAASITFDTRRYLPDANGSVLPSRSFEDAESFSGASEQLRVRRFAR